jgi:hypothetical protein
MGLSKVSRWVLKRMADPRVGPLSWIVLVDKIVKAGSVDNWFLKKHYYRTITYVVFCL